MSYQDILNKLRDVIGISAFFLLAITIPLAAGGNYFYMWFRSGVRVDYKTLLIGEVKGWAALMTLMLEGEEDAPIVETNQS